MRTQFEPNETDAFEATQDLLVRRCVGWAHQRQLTADPFGRSLPLPGRPPPTAHTPANLGIKGRAD